VVLLPCESVPLRVFSQGLGVVASLSPSLVAIDIEGSMAMGTAEFEVRRYAAASSDLLSGFMVTFTPLIRVR